MLKYTSKDTEKMIDVFASIADKKDNPEELYKEMLKIVDYPVPVLQEFLNCMTALEKKDEKFLKENRKLHRSHWIYYHSFESCNDAKIILKFF